MSDDHQQRSLDLNGETNGSSMLQFLLVLARHKTLVLSLPTGVGVVAIIVALLLPNWYAATTKIMPPQQAQTNAVAILGQLGALAAGGTASQALGLRNPSDIYVAMLKSESIANALIHRFDLRTVYDETLLHYARKQLARNSTITASREGVIAIQVEDKDPARAAALAAGYVEELKNLTLKLAVSEASQRRLFFESQLKGARKDLSEAESAFKKFAKETGAITQNQVGISVMAAASLRAQMTAKEIQLSAMRSFATETNPDMARLRQELAGLRTELAKIEQDAGGVKGDFMIPFGKAPDITVEYLRRLRDLKYHETLFEVFAKQYEIAKIDEAKDATLIQVLDYAAPPERKSRPARSLIVLLSVFAAAVVSVLAALAKESYQSLVRDPSSARAVVELRSLISVRKP